MGQSGGLKTAAGAGNCSLARTDCALRSVCFLTDRLGWVAGGSTTPYTRIGVGVILATRDGGKTWTSLARGSRPLPQLHFVRFFSPSDGSRDRRDRHRTFRLA